MRAVFMGTPEFAVSILSKLMGRHYIAYAITQPDRPKGRKKTLTPPPVKEFALKSGIEVLQPERIKDKDFIASLEIKASAADVFVVAAYGQILPEALLNMPKFGCINVHASLLPKYRGTAPVQRAIINGERVTGITIMKMDKGIDTGDIILQSEIKIEDSDTGGSLLEKMSVLGAAALIEALEQIENNTAVYTPQDNARATYAPMITKQTGLIDFNKTAEEISDLIRGLMPLSPAYTVYKNRELKILNAKITKDIKDGKPGEILEINKDGIVVKTLDYNIIIKDVLPEAGKKMDAAAFTRGRGVRAGERLCSVPPV